jgi:hypothetical protein
MYYTGIDPITMQEVHIGRNLRDRRMQRALLQYFMGRTITSWFGNR